MKPVKIKLKTGDSQGMYILLDKEELDKQKEYTEAPKRDYKIQIAVEAMYNNKRCRGKRVFNIRKNTSITKAIKSLHSKRQTLIDTLKSKGTLKEPKVSDYGIDTNSKLFKDCWNQYNVIRSIKLKQSTLQSYQDTYNYYLEPLYNKNIFDITIIDIQSIIHNMIKKGLSPSTISRVKATVKPILDHFDILLNWKKLVEPEVNNFRKYKRSVQDTIKIIQAMNNYKHPQVNGIFKFSLTGRRVSEILSLKYENINWEKNTYYILKEDVKTKKELEFNLTDDLKKAIHSRGKIKSSGKVFSLTRKWMYVQFKKCLEPLGITDMTLHDVRAMVAQTALDNGASIFDVSSMLAHTTVATTQKRYVDQKAKHSTNALNKFNEAIQKASNE